MIWHAVTVRHVLPFLINSSVNQRSRLRISYTLVSSAAELDMVQLRLDRPLMYVMPRDNRLKAGNTQYGERLPLVMAVC